MTNTSDTALDMLLDLVRTDINHPQQRLSLERYTYSGEGHEGSDFKEGERLYAARFFLDDSQGVLCGTGRTLEDACRSALRVCLYHMQESAKYAETSGKNSLEHAAWLRERIARVQSWG
jgi:hypothetical protein